MAEAGNQSAVLWMFATYGFYLLTLFGLRPLLLKQAESLTAREFKEGYPDGRRLHLLHKLLSLPAFLAFIAMPFLANSCWTSPSTSGRRPGWRSAAGASSTGSLSWRRASVPSTGS